MRKWILVLLPLAVSFARPAVAGDEAPRLERAYRTATQVAVAGAIAGAAALPALGASIPMIVKGSDETDPTVYALGMGLYVGGYAAATAGGAMLAGGSLAARGVLVKHAGVKLTPVPGALAWGTWGATVALAYVLPMAGVTVPGSAWIGVSCYVATFGLGLTQLFLNRAAYRHLPEGALEEASHTVALAPVVTRDQVGLAVTGTW